MRIQCTTCQATLEVPEKLSGQQGACPQCGAMVSIPAASRSASRLLVEASEQEMIAELHRRQQSAVLIEFNTPESGCYEISRTSSANVRCYRTADMDETQLRQVLTELGRMTRGPHVHSQPPVADAEDAAQPYELKGDRLGLTLDAFKTKYARNLGGGMSAPFCSDDFPGQNLEALHTQAWHAAAGIVHARIDLPSEANSPTVAGVATEVLLYQFVDQQLFRITALFATESFHIMREALCEKYGQPTSTRENPVAYVWQNDVSQIELIRGTIRPQRPSMLHLVHKTLHKLFQSRTPSRSQDL